MFRTVAETWGRLLGAGVLVFCLLTGLAPAALAVEDNPRLSLPPSRLDLPFQQPVYLAGHLGGGLGLEQDRILPGWGASVIFRPGAGDRFLSFLSSWNTALVLQADYQRLLPQSSILSADLVLRRYFGRINEEAVRVAPFLDVGLGASRVDQPGDLGRDKWLTWVVGIGKEWDLGERYVGFLKIQYRHYAHGELDCSTVTMAAGAGLPMPW